MTFCFSGWLEWLCSALRCKVSSLFKTLKYTRKSDIDINAKEKMFCWNTIEINPRIFQENCHFLM